MLAEDLDMVDKRAGTKLPHSSGQKHAQQAGAMEMGPHHCTHSQAQVGAVQH